MNLLEIQRRLIACLRTRVQNGEVTERGFARAIGVSQGHIHNVLKGIRSLSIEKSDLILDEFNYSVLDCVTTAEIEEHLAVISARLAPFRDLPFLIGSVGPGMPWPTQVDWHDQHPVPCVVTESAQTLRLMRLADDPEMEYTANGHNIAVLGLMDSEMPPDIVYAINRGHDTVLRRVRPGLRKLYLAADVNMDNPICWESVDLPFRPDLFRGQVRWLGKERSLRGSRSR